MSWARGARYLLKPQRNSGLITVFATNLTFKTERHFLSSEAGNNARDGLFRARLLLQVSLQISQTEQDTMCPVLRGMCYLRSYISRLSKWCTV